MLFQTPAFAAFFAIFLLFYLPFRQTRWGVFVIVVFSSVFYGSWDWRFLPLLWVTIVVDYLVGGGLGRTSAPSRRKLLLLVSVACNLAILGYFKYWNFLVVALLGKSALGLALRKPDLILPLGISFYIFQSMSYIIDVYRNRQKPLKSIFDFAAFVTFFPHLVAGPIQRIWQLVPQIQRPDPITVGRIASGVFLFSAGFLRKSLADLLTAFHDPVFKELAKSEPATVVAAVLSFGLQIYLDFAGYSEMAIGLARVLGIDLMDNFKAPYLSTSIREFWQRWHISLSNWLRDYLYISLGGSRAGWLRQARNLLLTMALCGLWHGAGWNFVLWGALHGTYLVVNSGVTKLLGEERRPRGSWAVLWRPFSWALTYLAANYAWIYFRLPTFTLAMLANQKIAAWLLNPAIPHVPQGVYLIGAAVLLMDVYTRWKDGLVPIHLDLTVPRALAYGVIAGLFFVVGIILNAGQPTQQFIYFQF